MTLAEITWRQAELDAFADWLTDHDSRDFLQYYYQRSGELDAERGQA